MPLNIHGLHQPGHGTTGDIRPFTAQLPPDLANAINLPVRIEDALDLRPKLRIPPGTIRQARRVRPLR
jgi:hypothetical protein